MIDTTKLNRIKIRDLFAVIKQGRTASNELQLLYIELLHQREERLLQNATDDDVRKAEELFIEEKLKIKYYPSQNKKVVNIKGQSRIVPIDKIYG